MDWSIGGGLRIGGHRGSSASAPENTLASFRRARDAGVDYLELDVRVTRDGVPVVFHDDSVDRTTDGTGAIEELSAAEVAGLDAGAWFGSAFAGERVPTLEAVLGFVEGEPRLGATVEAKGEATGQVIARAIAASPARDRISVCSFDAAELRAARASAPEVPRILILDRDVPGADAVALAHAAGATGVNVPLEWLDEDAVRRLHDVALFVAAGTVDDSAGIARCVGIGVDACDSNRPEVAVPARDGRGPAR